MISTIAVVVGVLLFSGAYLSRYQPLSASGTGAWWVDPRFATELGTFTPPIGDDFSAYRVRYEDGRTFRYAMSLYNDGPLPVTITTIGAPQCDGCVFPLVFERSFVGPAQGRHLFDVRHVEPFEPFVLGSGDFRLFLVQDRFDHCEAHEAGVTFGFTSIPITYRTGPVHHSVRLPMRFSLEVLIEPSGCPQGMR